MNWLLPLKAVCFVLFCFKLEENRKGNKEIKCLVQKPVLPSWQVKEAWTSVEAETAPVHAHSTFKVELAVEEIELGIHLKFLPCFGGRRKQIFINFTAIGTNIFIEVISGLLGPKILYLGTFITSSKFSSTDCQTFFLKPIFSTFYVPGTVMYVFCIYFHVISITIILSPFLS